jgi:hypothetical protein
MNTSPPKSWRQAGLILALIVGLGAFLCNAALAASGLLLVLIRGRQLSPLLTLPIFSLAVTGAGLGLPLAWQAVAGLSGWPSRRFALPLAWGLALVLMYLAALAGGQAVLSLQLAPALTLPPFHTAALALPPLLLLWGAAALAREPHYTWRQMWAGLGGAFGSLGLAFLIEVVLVLVGIVAVAMVIAVTPEMERFSHLPTPDSPAVLELMRLLLRQPVTIVVLLVGLGLVVPLVEEAVKSCVPALAGAWNTPSVTRLFLWGVAGGAGFALVEGMLNAGLSTDAWATVALLRVGSSAMHCLTAGLTGWGWGQARTQRKWLRLLLTYVLAVAIHGVWNSISGGMAILTAALDPGALQNALMAIAIGSLALLTLGMIAALMALAKRLSSRVGGVT